MNSDILSKKAGAISLAGVLSAGGIFTFLDARYVSASDFQQLTSAINDDRVERMELAIREANRRIKYITMIPESERTTWETQDLYDAQEAKESFIRRLERLDERME